MVQTEENVSLESIKTAKEMLLDENKLLTYISVSKDLCIHVNDAKNLLRVLVHEIKQNDPKFPLNVKYLISGVISDNKGWVTVCPESELETRQNAFKKIHFQHIYSVSKGSGVDNATLVCLNKFEDLLLCSGIVKGASCVKRSADEIDNLKSNSQKAIEIEKNAVSVKNEVKGKPIDVDNKPLNITKVQGSKSEPLIKSEKTSPDKDKTNGVIGKSAIKSSVKTSKNIIGFFTKSVSTPDKVNSKKETATAVESKSETKKEQKIEVKKEIKSEIKKETKSRNKQEEEMDVDVESPDKEVKVKKEPESAKKASAKNNSLKSIKKNAKIDKKRKRVLHVSDSESDEDPFADEKEVTNNESEDEIPPTPSTNTVKITSGILNPKKRRKIIDKTYTDEEGYILTRKEEVYESCSDEEMEPEPHIVETAPIKTEKENVQLSNKVKSETSPKKAKNTKKKVSPPQKGKQANIMSFFKKV